jgi:hypothetical protein
MDSVDPSYAQKLLCELAAWSQSIGFAAAPGFHRNGAHIRRSERRRQRCRLTACEGTPVCLPQIKSEHIDGAVRPGSDDRECVRLSRRRVISARFVLGVLVSPFKSKLRFEAENAVLRHQLIVLRRKLRGRVRLANSRRTTTAPVVSTPTTLQEFLPRSTPRIIAAMHTNDDAFLLNSE